MHILPGEKTAKIYNVKEILKSEYIWVIFIIYLFASLNFPNFL